MSETLTTVLAGAMVLGLAAGSLGCFAVLRRHSLLGDAVAHAALPGACLAFLFGSWAGIDPKHPLLLLLAGALGTAWVGTLLILGISRTTRLKQDAAIGIVLSVFFGAGMVLLTIVQSMGNARQAGLDKFLFGQAAALTHGDVIAMAVLAAVVLGALLAAMLVTPAAAARQWTDRPGVMIAIAGGLGMAAGAAGAWISALQTRIPTGPVIVLSATALLFVSLLVSPRRGLLWAWVRRRRNRRRVRIENLLKDFWRLSERDSGYASPRAVSDVAD